MFSQLIASRPARTQGAEGTTASLVLHGLFITAAIIATAKGPAVLAPPSSSRIVPLTAPMASAATPPRAAAPRATVAPRTPAATPTIPVDVPPIAAPSEIPSTIPVPTDGAMPVLYPEGGTPSTPGTGDPNGSPIGTGGALGAESVDVAARLLANSPLPRYPDILRTRGLEGGARVRFVVNANGRAELETLEVLEATHPAFVEAVRAVLPRLRFAPARLGRDNVRQLVEIPFGFTLTARR